MLSMRYDADWLEGVRPSCFQSRVFQSPMLLTSKAPASNATCNMLAERGIAKAAEAIYANANAADRAGTAGAAGASMPRGQLWKMTSLEALLVDGCGWRVVEPQTITNCCDLLWLSCGFPWFPVVLRTFIPSSCPAARLPSAFPTVIIVIYRQISFSLMPIILRHCVRATIHQPCPVFFSGQTRGCCILWCVLWCLSLCYDFPGSSFQRHRCMAQAQ